jgi:coenzyme F420-0:L-glutamate ligase
MELYAIKTKKVKPGDNLVDIVLESLKKLNLQLKDNDVLALTSKIVSYAENRLVNLKEVKPSDKAKKLAQEFSLEPEFGELVLREADKICGGVERAVLTLKNEMLVANAGIDSKNAPVDYVALWPSNPSRWAKSIREEIYRRTCKRIAVLIIDSGLIPLRIGTIGLALAVAGFKPIRDHRGESDLYGKEVIITRHAIADDLASAAHLLMGESIEQTPAVLIRDAPVDFDGGAYGPETMMMPQRECIFMNNRQKFADSH